MGGNITRQPAMQSIPHEIVGDLSGCDYIMDNGLFIGNHQALRTKDLEILPKLLNEFIK